MSLRPSGEISTVSSVTPVQERYIFNDTTHVYGQLILKEGTDPINGKAFRIKHNRLSTFFQMTALVLAVAVVVGAFAILILKMTQGETSVELDKLKKWQTFYRPEISVLQNTISSINGTLSWLIPGTIAAGVGMAASLVAARRSAKYTDKKEFKSWADLKKALPYIIQTAQWRKSSIETTLSKFTHHKTESLREALRQAQSSGSNTTAIVDEARREGVILNEKASIPQAFWEYLCQ